MSFFVHLTSTSFVVALIQHVFCRSFFFLSSAMASLAWLSFAVVVIVTDAEKRNQFIHEIYEWHRHMFKRWLFDNRSFYVVIFIIREGKRTAALHWILMILITNYALTISFISTRKRKINLKNSFPTLTTNVCCHGKFSMSFFAIFTFFFLFCRWES